MRITCLGHSGFAVESGDGSATLIFDYYTDNAGALAPVMARAQSLYVFVSHSHRDHLCHDIFGWHGQWPVARYIVANECRRKLARAIDLSRLPVTWLHRGDVWADGTVGVHALGSTDVGVSYVVDFDGRRLLHAGDYTCWQAEGAPEAERRKARGDFHAVLRALVACAPRLDVAMMPVVPNLGGDFAYGARQLLQAVDVDLFIPMHMWGRDREATQFGLYANPAHGSCSHVPEGESIDI